MECNVATATEQKDASPLGGSLAYTLGQMVGYMLGLGIWGFGGPVALVGYMHYPCEAVVGQLAVGEWLIMNS